MISLPLPLSVVIAIGIFLGLITVAAFIFDYHDRKQHYMPKACLHASATLDAEFFRNIRPHMGSGLSVVDLEVEITATCPDCKARFTFGYPTRTDDCQTLKCYLLNHDDARRVVHQTSLANEQV